MKKTFIPIFAMILILLTIAGLSYSASVLIYINNEPLYTDSPAVIRNGRTMVPISAIGNALNCKVMWNSKNQGIVISKGSDIVRLSVGNRLAYINDTPVSIDQSPVIMNSRTMVPLSFISKSMKEKVRFDPSNMSVYVDSVNLASAKLSDEGIFLDKVLDRNTYEMSINGEKKTVILNDSSIKTNQVPESSDMSESYEMQSLSNQIVNSVIESGDISLKINQTLENGDIIADIYIDGALLEVLLGEKEKN